MFPVAADKVQRARKSLGDNHVHVGTFTRIPQHKIIKAPLRGHDVDIAWLGACLSAKGTQDKESTYTCRCPSSPPYTSYAASFLHPFSSPRTKFSNNRYVEDVVVVVSR